MIVVTTNEVPTKEIVEVKGVVHGIVVRTPTIKQGVFGGLKNIIGGSNNSYTEMCEQTRESAYKKMIDHAESIGANAVVAFRFDSDGVGGDQTRANEVFCYGTAVRVR